MKITAKKVGQALLPQGYHDVTIQSVEETSSKPNAEYDDVTPQLAIAYKNDSGFITAWYNMLGYMLFDKLTPAQQKSGEFEASSNGYAIRLVKNKAGKVVKRERVVSDEHTQKCLEIVGKLATNAGFAADEEIDAEELVGKEVGIAVKANNQGQLRVEWSFKFGEAEAIAEREAAKEAAKEAAEAENNF